MPNDWFRHDVVPFCFLEIDRNDPKKSVVNSFCQSHDISNLFVIDGSCFVTMGIANPSLTIHAIAVRASEYIVKLAKKGNI